MNQYEHEEQALCGIGTSVAAGGLVTLSGATTATTGFLATGLSSMVAVAPTAVKGAILVGQCIASSPIAPIVIIGGIGYALYHCICGEYSKR